MGLAIWIGVQAGGLLVAVLGILYGMHFAFIAAAVVVFLLGGRMVRQELGRRGFWADDKGGAGAAAPATAAEEDPGADRSSGEPPKAVERPHQSRD